VKIHLFSESWEESLWKTREDKENRARIATARRTPTLSLSLSLSVCLSVSLFLFPSISLSLPYGMISCKALLSRCGNFIFATNLQPPSPYSSSLASSRRFVLCPVTLLRARVSALLLSSLPLESSP